MFGICFQIFSDHKILKYLFTQKDLNLRHYLCVEYMEDYDYSLKYHLGKANVVTDTLSHKSSGILACLTIKDWRRKSLVSNYSLQFE